MFVGFVTIFNGVLRCPLQTRNGSDDPADADALPTYRVYGPGGLMTNGTGSFALKDAGTVTGATNASPIVVTSANHKLTTGMRVTISGVLGNLAANGTFQVTVVNSNSFSLDGSTGNGAYTSGGAWHASGLYDAQITVAGADGYDTSEFYTVLAVWKVSGSTRTELFRFGVY